MGAIHPKVAGFTISGAIVVIVIWTLGLISAKLQVPSDVASAMTTVIGAVIAYYVPSADAAPPVNQGNVPVVINPNVQPHIGP